MLGEELTESTRGNLAELGPHFVVGTHPHSASPTRPWLPLSNVLDYPGVLMERIERVREALAAAGPPAGELEIAVAASLTQLGLAGRLIAPCIALDILHQVRFEVLGSSVWWQNDLGGAFPLSVALRPAPGRPGAGTTGSSPLIELLDGPVDRAIRVVSAVVPVSSRVLWGNVASVVNSATMTVAETFPSFAERSRQVAGSAFDDPRLAAETSPPGPGFRRSSCCLLTRVAGTAPLAVCSDCGLGG